MKKLIILTFILSLHLCAHIDFAVKGKHINGKGKATAFVYIGNRYKKPKSPSAEKILDTLLPVDDYKKDIIVKDKK